MHEFETSLHSYQDAVYPLESVEMPALSELLSFIVSISIAILVYNKHSKSYSEGGDGKSQC